MSGDDVDAGTYVSTGASAATRTRLGACQGASGPSWRGRAASRDVTPEYSCGDGRWEKAATARTTATTNPQAMATEAMLACTTRARGSQRSAVTKRQAIRAIDKVPSPI